MATKRRGETAPMYSLGGRLLKWTSEVLWRWPSLAGGNLYYATALPQVLEKMPSLEALPGVILGSTKERVECLAGHPAKRPYALHISITDGLPHAKAHASVH
ncbi:hypothetical protein HPB48_003205 [Haemaphysalis longicornis]|uniref:Uncharacterized protein n=1 Tax=Haemaphysalis longicornis TaxID=44386 RepID=A0A9J6G9T8_HAELO|nr:hypothetical protein HPB48_003205 [Haemaphysalis longicornis]